MKIKFSKVMAIVCALSVAFAGLTAFAATTDAVVTTTTEYDAYENADTLITVTTNVTGKKGEVTYYVSKADGTIVYINQDTAGDDGKVSFTFKAKQGDVLAATAKYGTDASEVAFPTFAFVEGANYLTNGSANVTEATCTKDTKYIPIKDDGTDGAEATASYVFKAKVSGNAIEYGIKLDNEYYPAAGCEADGTFMVIINGVDLEDVNAIAAYAKDKDAEKTAAITLAQ